MVFEYQKLSDFVSIGKQNFSGRYECVVRTVTLQFFIFYLPTMIIEFMLCSPTFSQYYCGAEGKRLRWKCQ